MARRKLTEKNISQLLDESEYEYIDSSTLDINDN